MNRKSVGWIAKRAIEAARTNKAKSPLRGFEYVELQGGALPPNPSIASSSARPTGKLPNAEYMYQDDLREYRSYAGYVREALKARARYNADSEEGWWLKVNEFQGHTEPPPKSSTKLTTDLRYRNTKKLRTDIMKANTKAMPITQSKINAVIDLEELSAVDNYVTNKDRSQIPDEALTGSFVEEQVPEILAHNGIFQDLAIRNSVNFAKFSAVENANIHFGAKAVLFGNEISPGDASAPPRVEFETDADYTVACISLDSGLHKKRNYLHWLWSSKGDTTHASWLPFIPTRGTGYHRMVFLVFKEIDISVNTADSSNLFARKNIVKNYLPNINAAIENNLVSIKFINTRWDKTVTKTFAETLKIKEPVYEYNDWHDEKNDAVPLTQLTQEDMTIEDFEAKMAKEEIYPGGGGPQDYELSRVWNEFNQSWTYRRRQPGM